MQIEATVRRVNWPKEIKGREWAIIQTDQGTVKGEISWMPVTGEMLRLDGKWQVYKGEREFAFKSAIAIVPSSARDQLTYLAEQTVGMGPKMAEAVWEQWGETWADNMQPDVVRGLTGETWHNLLEAVQHMRRQQERVNMIAWLMGKGATIAMAEAAWDMWGGQMVGVIQFDVYRLTELHGYGFAHADRLRHHFGVTDSDPRRIRAGVIYAMGQLTQGGSTLIRWEMLGPSVAGFVGPYHQIIADTVRELMDERYLIAFAEQGALALAEHYEAETAIWTYAQEAS